MNRIKLLRKKKGMSQEELAGALNIHQTAVSQWETGKTSPDMSVIPALSEFFNVTSDYLLGISLHKKEPTPRDGMAQEILDMLEKVPDEKLPKFMTLLQTAIDATT